MWLISIYHVTIEYLRTQDIDLQKWEISESGRQCLPCWRYPSFLSPTFWANTQTPKSFHFDAVSADDLFFHFLKSIPMKMFLSHVRKYSMVTWLIKFYHLFLPSGFYIAIYFSITNRMREIMSLREIEVTILWNIYIQYLIVVNISTSWF